MKLCNYDVEKFGRPGAEPETVKLLLTLTNKPMIRCGIHKR